MYKKCKTKHSINRQRTIELCFLNLLKLKFYEDVTVSEICKFADIPRKAFYRYFDCKESLLKALIKHSLESFQAYYASLKTEKRTVQSELNFFFAFWKTEPIKTLLDVLNKNSLTEHLLKFSREAPRESFINVEKFFPSESPWLREQILNFAIQGLMSLMLDWYNGGFKNSTEEMAGVACRMLQSPLFPNLGKLGITNE